MRRILILLPLPLIAAWVFYSGMNYQADELVLGGSKPESVYSLPAVERFSGPGNRRSYGIENLYEYVNGHAEFFISSGFVSLTVAEYNRNKKGEAVVEVYDMGNHDNVLAVITSERGSAKPLEGLGGRAFISKGGLMFGKGGRFIRIGNFGLTGEDALYLAETISKSLAPEKAAGSMSGGAAAFLPSINMMADSEGFVKSDYLGLSFLGDVKTAKYVFGEIESEGFHIPSPPDEMIAFFREEGSTIDKRFLDGVTLYSIDDKYEGKINIISNGHDSIGIRGDIPKEGLDVFINEATGRLKRQ